MSSEQHLPGLPELRYVECQTSRTVRAGTLVKMATAASQLATARPAKTLRADNLFPGTYRTAYTRTSADINLLYLAWFYRCDFEIFVSNTLTVSLVITDGTNTVGPSDARIPYAFQGNATALARATANATPAGVTMGGEGWFDLDELALVLLGDDWAFEFTVTRSGSTPYVDHIEGFEVPRTSVRDAVTPDADEAGSLTGPFNPGNPITAGTVDSLGLLRLETTLQAAVARCTQYLSLSWINDITAAIPKTSSATFAALSNFRESAGVPIPFKVRVLPKYVAAPPGTADGEAGRFRVLFYVEGGGTAQVRLNTGATASPYDTGSLTGASWQWSQWVDCELPTDGTDQLADLTFEALTSAGTVYLAGILVEERAA